MNLSSLLSTLIAFCFNVSHFQSFHSSFKSPFIRLKNNNIVIMNANSGSGNPTLLDSTERLSEIAANWRVVQYGQNDVFGLECINTYFGETTLSVRLSREGGLGLDLVEVSNKDPKHGLVVINEIIPDSNAAKSKILQLGDALISISGATPSGNLICNLQGLSLDATFNELGRFSEASEVVIVARRLIKRKNVVVRVYGSEGEYFTNFTVLSGYGANLRTALISNNIRLYDSRTERVDSPYQQGDCGGDGSCGTCMVAILAGAELVSPKVKQEELGLKKSYAPPNYRWACRTKIATSPDVEGTLHVKLRPQTAGW